MGEARGQPVGQRRRRAREAALLLAAAVLFGEVCTLPLAVAARARVAGAPPTWLLPLDDAYIFVRYTQQAARGRPWQWNTGEPSTGASSVLWPWLLVPAHWLSADLAAWSRWSRWMGVASLWALGLAAARTLRAAGLAEPWPLAGGLCLVWSGPIGFGAVAGMESAANAALLALACALWMESLRGGPCRSREPAWRSARVWAPAVTALLPFGRPENGVLAALAALALVLGVGGSGGRLLWPRWTGAAVLVPGALLAACNRIATGSFEPAGALAKSWLHVPYLPLGGVIDGYLAVLRKWLVPVYLGLQPALLWPPVGLLAIGTAAAAFYAAAAAWARARRGGGTAAAGIEGLALLAPMAAAWLLLAALAPFSPLLHWQEMRHHHAGLALAWLLAFAGAGLAGAALGARRAASGGAAAPAAHHLGRFRSAPLLLPLPLLLAFPHWARDTARGAAELYRGHARAAAWLAAHAHQQALLLTDAGLLSLAHDGPAIDALGLCSPGLAEAALNGPGALVESLARRRPLPEIAAVEQRLLQLPQLLGEPLLPGPPPPGEVTELARVRRELLNGTALSGPGLDFAYLPDERRHHLRWRPAALPPPPQTSVALLLPGPVRDGGAGGGAAALQGCRPLLDRVGVELPPETRVVRLLAATLAPARAGEVAAVAGDGDGPAGPPLADGVLAADRWSEVTVALPPGRAAYLWLLRRSPGVPCLESLSFGAGAAAGQPR